MIGFQYFSDLHLERYVNTFPKIKQIADNLILAGDIGHPETEIYNEFFSYYSKKYENIYLVHGNHEVSFLDKQKINEKKFTEKNIHLLNNNFFIHKNKILIAGSILWTPKVNTIENTKSIHFLHDMVENSQYQKKIFITHYLPSYELIVKKYHQLPYKKYQDRYANHLDYLMRKKQSPQVWICGHSHSVVKKKIHNTMCYINTFGPTCDSKFEI